MSDLISRQDAIEAVCDKCPISFKEKCEWKDNGHCSMQVALEALPSAGPKTDGVLEQIRWERDVALKTLEEHGIGFAEKQKTGEWMKVIDEETPNVTKWHYECDQCGAGRWEKGQRYCQNCGARMHETEVKNESKNTDDHI